MRSSRFTRRFGRFALALFVAITSCAAILFSSRNPGRGASVLVDMEASAGHRIELFLNDLSIPPKVLAVQPGVRQTYVFPGVPETIELLRIDPTDAAQADVRIYSVAVMAGDRTLARFEGPQLREWFTSTVVARDDPSAFAFTTLSIDSTLVTRPQIRGGSAVIGQAVTRTLAERPHLPIVLLLPALLVTSLVRKQTAAAIGVVGVAVTLVPWLVQMSRNWRAASEPLGVAVSRASFLGEQLATHQIVMVAALVLAIAAAILIAVVGPARDSAGSDGVLEIGMAPRGRALLATWWVVLAFLLAPDLAGELAGIHSIEYVPHWDSDQYLYWSFLASRGDVPFRDFWFPYGGQYLFHLALPVGPAARWIFDVLLYGLLSTCLWVLVPRRQFEALAVVAVLLAADRIGLIPGAFRYLLAVNVVLSYLAASRISRLTPGITLLVTLTLALAIIFELPQVLYAIPALGFVWLVDTMSERPHGWHEVLRTPQTPVLFAVVSLAIVLIVVARLAWSGQLQGVVDLYARAADQVDYSAWPTPISHLGWRLLDLQLLVLWWPVAATALGLYERLSATTTDAKIRGSAMMAIGLLAFLVLQKHLMRPMETQMIVYPLVAVLLFALLTPRPMPLATSMTLAVAVGVLASVIVVRDSGAVLWNTVGRAPARLVGAIRILSAPSLVALANGERFAPARFEQFFAERQLVSELQTRVQGRLSVFTLTDAPIVYVLTGQSVVWMSNMYNASPVYEQRRVVDWLMQEPPNFVVFEADRLQFDEVPAAVRVPLVVRAVIEGYVPDGRIGRFEVLRRRAALEPLAIDYWRDRLGAVLNLGHVPAAIDISDRALCVGGHSCDEYVTVHLPPPIGSGQTATLQFEEGDRPFEVRFSLEPGRGRYVIPLSRLWFWSEGLSARLHSTPEGPLRAVGEIHPIKLELANDRLY